METFFPDDSPLRYWLCNASVSHIACTVSWPPIISAIGYAPCVRAWAPTSRDEPEFKPVLQLLEVDGERFVAVTVKADILVAADASSSGRISIWDTSSWTRQQTLTAGAAVTALDASRTFIAAGTAAGYVRVWKRQSALDATFTQFFAPDLQLDCLPVTTVRLGPLRLPGAGGGGAGTGAGGGSGGSGGGGGGGGGSGGDAGADAMMVVHTRGNGRVSAWRLSDAKIIGTLGRSGPPDSPEALLSANVVAACLSRDTLLTCSWMQGRDPLLQWICPVQRAAGEVPGISQHLAGLARPLCCDYDGNCIVMGCEDGTVWVWGLVQSPGPQGGPAVPSATSAASSPPQQQSPQQQQQLHNTTTATATSPDVAHWRGYHRGAVGAVACLPHRGGQVASAGADGCVKLWSPGGLLVAVARLGWQPTALAVNELALVVGGAAGQIQILVLLPEEQAASAASRPTEEERVEAATAPATTTHGSSVAEYAYWFDARLPKAAAAAGSGGGGGAAAGPWGLVSEHRDAFAAFVPPRRQVTLADLQQHRAAAGGGASASGNGSGGTAGAPAAASGDAAAVAAAAAAPGATGSGAAPDGSGTSGGAGGKASSFNMQAALKGAQRSAADQAAALAAEEEAKRAQLRAMGEGPGVARSRGTVQLDSATAAMGRKCSNPSCLQREGLLALQQQQPGAAAGGFKRCGACKSAFYCSTHCQSTHWRDGHKKECPLLAEAWRRQQEELRQQHQEHQQLQHGQQRQQTPCAVAGAGARGGAADGTGMGGSRPSSSTQAAGPAGNEAVETSAGSGGEEAGGEEAVGNVNAATVTNGSLPGVAAVDCLNELD